jgi:hypothetical protein
MDGDVESAIILNANRAEETFYLSQRSHRKKYLVEKKFFSC